MPHRRLRRKLNRFRGAKAIAKKALREVNKIKSNIEVKFQEETISKSPVAGTAGIQHISKLAEGVGDNQRLGNQVSAVSLQIRGSIEMSNPTGIFENELVRIIVFIDKDAETLKTDLDDLLLDTTVFFSMRDPAHMNDFRVLMDKTITLQNLSLSTDSSLRFFSFFKRFKRPIKIKFDAPAESDTEENAIYIAFQVAESVLAGSIVVTGRSIMKYTDM